jgi:hypothetical protein
MENMMSFAAVATAIFVSFAVALVLEWISLVALMYLMPARQGRRVMPQLVAAPEQCVADQDGSMQGGRPRLVA